MIRRTLLSISLLVAACLGAEAALVNGRANAVLGQTDFTAEAAAVPSLGGMKSPSGVAVDEVHNRVFVSDRRNNRVLWWTDARDFQDGASPAGVLGQGDLTGVSENRGLERPGAGTLRWPGGVFVDAGGNVWVADTGNSRVLRFPYPQTTGMKADLQLGQESFSGGARNRNLGAPTAATLNYPAHVFVQSDGVVWVADHENHRVLKYPAPVSSGSEADLVLGQVDFVHAEGPSVTHDDVVKVVRADTFYAPESVTVDAAGAVWVGDHLNHRVLRFQGPFSNGMAADLVLGQADFAGGIKNRGQGVGAETIYCACAAQVDPSGNLWVVDRSNNRVLRYRAPFRNGEKADFVLGQPDLNAHLVNRSGDAGPDTMAYPSSLFVDSTGSVWVVESTNHRMLRFDALQVTSISAPKLTNAGSAEITVLGKGFVPGTKARLVSGGVEVPASSVTVDSETSLRAVFDLTGVPGGEWDIVLTYGTFSSSKEGAVSVAAVTVSSIDPARAVNDGPVNVTIGGENFFAGIQPRLSQPGVPDIQAQTVSLVSETQLTCTFDITDATTGYWSVVVPPAVGSAVLENAFTVVFPTATTRAIRRDRSYRIGIETEQGAVVTDIPAYTFSEDLTMSFRVPDPASLPAHDPEQCYCCDVCVEITADKDLEPQKYMGLSFHYNDGYIGTLEKRKMSVFYYADDIGRWLRVGSQPCADRNLVTGRTRHLSLFRLMQQVVGADLSGVVVYPNPYRPASGTAFDSGQMGEGITFDGLTADARVRIFTVAGNLVADLVEDNADGVVFWDTRTRDGDRAASGVYIYYITNPDDGSQEKKGKFAIIR